MSPRVVISLLVVCLCLASTEGRAFKNEKARFKRQAGSRCVGGVREDPMGEIEFGSGQYQNNEDCCFELRPYFGGSFTVDLEFSVFDIEQGPRCSYDYVTYGTSDGITEIDCGTKDFGYIRSFNSTDSFQLCFHSDASIVGRGISVLYITLPVSEENSSLPALNYSTTPSLNVTASPSVNYSTTPSLNVTASPSVNATSSPETTGNESRGVPRSHRNCTFSTRADHGMIQSLPGIGEDYENNLNCSYVFNVPRNSSIHFNFTTFDLEGGNGCPYDYVQINGGRRWCGSTINGRQVNGTGEVVLRFVTDGSVTSRGFVARFNIRMENGTSPNTRVAPANTTVAPSNTTVAPGNTTVAPGNTTVAPGNSTVAPSNTTVAPSNTAVAPSNTTVAPGNTTVAPGNTTVAPSNTTVAPSNTTVAPANTTVAPSNTTVAPGNTTVAPSNTTVAPGNTTVAPGNTTIAPGNTTVAPGNSTVAPGNTTVAPSNTTVPPGNTTVAPGNTTVAPSNTTVAPGNTTVAPGNTTVAPSNTTVAPGNTTVAPSNTTVAPGNSTVAPGNTTVAPSNTTVAPGNTTVAPSNTTVAPSSTTVAPSNTTVAPGNTTVAPSNTTVAPGNTTVAPSNTTVAPSNTTVAPGNTTVAPSNTTVAPGNTTVAPSNMTVEPSDETTYACNYDTASLEGRISLATDIDGFYANNEECRINLYSPALPHVTTINFTRFDVEYNSNCRYDSLSVRLGNNTIDTLCGNNRSPFVKLYSNAEPLLAMTFVSDSSVSGLGFAFDYQTEVEYCNAVINGTSGSFATPPGGYSPNMACTYTINTPTPAELHFTFEEFDIESASRCMYDAVTMGEDRLCGSSPGSKTYQSDGTFVITFTSDGSVQREGFYMSFTSSPVA
ncbi:autotransporter adhesin BpaC-like [Haliotis cracherodii]|uniref:autotransporter adhesin BpaC-like n=1 Tax=Haliotis cracherodii TaxID=6455 RepID=UPI0039EAE134